MWTAHQEQVGTVMLKEAGEPVGACKKCTEALLGLVLGRDSTRDL